MKKFIICLLFITSMPSFAYQEQSLEIDTTAVSKLLSLVNAEAILSVESIKKHYINNDSGGLDIHLQSFYSNLTEEDWQKIEHCSASLNGLNRKVEVIKARLLDISNSSLDRVKIYGIVGAGNTAATANQNGAVLGLELICLVGMEPNKLQQTFESYIAHELVHVLQHRLTKRANFNFNLLEISLLEGSADYIAELLLGNNYILDDDRYDFGSDNAHRLIVDFKVNMLSSKFSPWLYSNIDSMPRDMGYWVGYQIAKAYMENGGTIIDLLTMEDAEVILKRSGI